MICPKCGAQNADNVPFCSRCGNRFDQQVPTAPYVQPMNPGYPAPPATNPGKGLGIASMVLGIVSLVLFCFIYVSIPCALVGVILGGIGMKKSKDAGMPAGMAVAGLVCSIVCLAIVVILYATGAATLASLGL